ncbi:multidrug efflux SMR transporter [Cyanobium sp. FGCU-52]|nr:multidrug efflux SMR transporter [Cyanobium sp. FGCU52]
MTHWLVLAMAIVAEVVGTTSLKASDGTQKPLPSLLVVVGYALAFFFMSQTLKVIPVGVTYAVWSGFGIVLVINLFSRSSAHGG